MLTHKNLIANTRSILEYLRLTRDDSVMAVLPFAFAYGNSVMLTHLFVGGTLVIENSLVYPHVVLESMMKTGVTGLSGVSTTYAIMLNQSNLKSYSFPSLRYITHAGGPMPSELLNRLRSVFPGKSIFLMYGQTEATARISYLPFDKLDEKLGSAGLPLDQASSARFAGSGRVIFCSNNRSDGCTMTESSSRPAVPPSSSIMQQPSA